MKQLSGSSQEIVPNAGFKHIAQIEGKSLLVNPSQRTMVPFTKVANSVPKFWNGTLAYARMYDALIT